MWSRREIASQVLVKSGLGAVLRVSPWLRQGVLILNYHRIGVPGTSAFDHGLWSATAEAFEQQVNFIKRNCRVISPLDLLDEQSLEGEACAMITFDDGYRDNYEVAFPILKKHGVSATFFVTTGFIDSPRVAWWDEIAWMVHTSNRPSITAAGLGCDMPLAGQQQQTIERLLSTYKALPPTATEAFLNGLAQGCGTGRCTRAVAGHVWMTWDMLREMASAGMTIGGHTVDHPILSRLSASEQQYQINACMTRLEREVSLPGRFLAYPRGKGDSFNDDTRAALYEARIDLAFSYYGGFNEFGNMDPYDVKRVAIELDTVREDFESVVSMPAVFG